MKKCSCRKNLLYYTIFIVIAVLCLSVLYYNLWKKRHGKESFDNFSPIPNCMNQPLIESAKKDKEQLKLLTREWERPYNNNDYGYENMEPSGLPPSNPIYSFPTLNLHPNYGPEDEKMITYKDVFDEKNGNFIGYEMILKNKDPRNFVI